MDTTTNEWAKRAKSLMEMVTRAESLGERVRCNQRELESVHIEMGKMLDQLRKIVGVSCRRRAFPIGEEVVMVEYSEGKDGKASAEVYVVNANGMSRVNEFLR